LLYAIVSQLGVGKAAALLAAGVTAAHPLAILWSGVLVRQPTYLFAVFGSTLALIGFLQRGKRRRFLAFVLGAVLATTSRPEGAHVVILYLAVLLVVPANRPARQAVALALALLTPLAFVYIRYVLEMGGGQALTGHRLPVQWTILFSRDFTPLAWIVAWTLGLLFGGGPGSTRCLSVTNGRWQAHGMNRSCSFRSRSERGSSSKPLFRRAGG
jgi:hypothetical protein